MERGFPLTYRKDQGVFYLHVALTHCQGLVLHVLFSSDVDKVCDALMWSRLGPVSPPPPRLSVEWWEPFAGITGERSYLGRSRVSQLHRELMLCAVITLNLGARLCFLALTVATVNTAGKQLMDCVFCSEQLQKTHRHNSQYWVNYHICLYIFSWVTQQIYWLNWTDEHAFSC